MFPCSFPTEQFLQYVASDNTYAVVARNEWLHISAPQLTKNNDHTFIVNATQTLVWQLLLDVLFDRWTVFYQ